MNELELPKQLKGPWHHALILTYGADLPFWEQVVWRQFSARCRNKVILADGQQYLDACENYARSGTVRYLNQKYVVEGISSPRAAHGKVILLLNPDQGRLLAGSGNLGLQGYASGGEMFTQYEYSGEPSSSLNAFLAVRELVDSLIERGYIAGLATKRIQRAWQETPWLFQTPVGDWQPVRHNLIHSFLDQLQQLIGDRPVEDLWILAPFYDREAAALKRLLATFQPRQVSLLLQTGSTSIDPVVLRDVIKGFSVRFRMYAVTREGGSPYVHAKMYLFKLSDRAVCLQGSPNASQVAMLLSVPQGNVEIANLLEGPRNTFDYLLESLNPQPKELDELELAYEPITVDRRAGSTTWHLTGGEWQDDRLILRFQGTLPDLEGASLRIAGRQFAIQACEKRPRELEVQLSADAIDLLHRPVPVELFWEEEDSPVSSPVFVCNIAALDAEISVSDDDEVLEKFGDLDLDDDEFERLLGELDSALMIDRRSVWQLAGRDISSQDDKDDDALRLKYIDVDYPMLRQHPKMQQYIKKRDGGSGYGRSRLQIILSAITAHFSGLLEKATDHRQAVVGVIGDLEQDEQGTEEDHDQEADQKQRRRWTHTRRLRNILTRFVRRYLRGIRSSDFQELAGFEVIAQNYVIFSHLLWRLFARDEWVKSEFILESVLEMWSFFWGIGRSEGYFGKMSEEAQSLALLWIREHHADAVFLATLYYGAFLSRRERWTDLRLDLRNAWRDVLERYPFPITGLTIEEAWHATGHLIPYEPPRPTDIMGELTDLARFDTRMHFCRDLEEAHGYPTGSCSFDDRCHIFRESLGRKDTVSCLEIRAKDALTQSGSAVALLKAWMRFEERDYYRVHQKDGERLVFYDTVIERGLYYSPEQGMSDLESIRLKRLAWEDALSDLIGLAKQVEVRIQAAMPRPEVVTMTIHGSTSSDQSSSLPR